MDGSEVGINSIVLARHTCHVCKDPVFRIFLDLDLWIEKRGQKLID